LTARPLLRRRFQEDWSEPLGEYAPRLFGQAPKTLAEDFLALVEQEATATGYEAGLARTLTAQLGQLPVVQTSHHITPTHGPTFTSIDLISLSGLGPGRIYPIFAFSGVPFSNSAWSGALSYGALELTDLFLPQSKGLSKAKAAAKERQAHGEADHRISLIPAKSRDQLVYGSLVPENLPEILAELQPKVQALLAEPRPQELYSHWAARTSAKLQSRLFGQQVVVLDLNRLVGLFLRGRLRAHDPLFLALFGGTGPSLELNFLVGKEGKKSNKVELKPWVGGLDPMGISGLIEALETQALSPGVWLCFFVLRFYLGLHCLGSFNQLEYLEDYRLGLQGSPLAPALDLSPGPPSLTTGRLVWQGAHLWPLDRVCAGQSLDCREFAGLPMSRFWSPIARQLGLERLE